jgi:hypothetical protein
MRPPGQKTPHYKAHNAPKDRNNHIKRREELAADVEAFLAGGGKITQIERGVSGHVQSRHITFSKKRMAES